MIAIDRSIRNQHFKARSWIYQAVRFTQEGTILSRAKQVFQDALGIQWVE